MKSTGRPPIGPDTARFTPSLSLSHVLSCNNISCVCVCIRMNVYTHLY